MSKMKDYFLTEFFVILTERRKYFIQILSDLYKKELKQLSKHTSCYINMLEIKMYPEN